MLIDRTHRPWALASAAVLAAASLVYAVAASRATGPWSGGSPIGLAYGIAGFAMMAFAGLLSVRKTFRIWRIGRAQTWMRGHLWLGLLSLPIIALHAGFAAGGPLTRVLMWLFAVVVVSGIVGAALQHVLPRRMLDRVPMETIYEQIPHVRAQLAVEGDGIVAAACGALATEAAAVTGGDAGAASDAHARLATVERAGADESAPLREFYMAEMRPFLLDPERPHPLGASRAAEQAFARLRTLVPPSFHAAVADLESLCEEERQLSRQETLHRWLHGWLLVHVPLSFALLALAVVHIVAALRY